MTVTISEKGGGIALMIFALIFLGTWPALFNLLERRGRKPSHTFLDYCCTNFLVAIVVAFTLGQIGAPTATKPNFTTQLGQDNGPSVGWAIAGGFLLFLGNQATQYGLAYAGLSVTEVVASSITVVGGTTINYFLDDKINKASVLFPGVACFLVAAILGSFVHASNKADIDEKLGITRSGNGIFAKASAAPVNAIVVPTAPTAGQALGHEYQVVAADAVKDVEGQDAKLPAGSQVGDAAYLRAVEQQRAIKVTGASKVVGIGIVVFAGLCYVLFSPAFNLATNDQWHNLRPGVPHLVVYTAFFYFSATFFACAWAFNLFTLYRPILGAPRSSLGEYLRDHNGRLWALLAGIICGMGNTMQFMGGQAAGYAAADSVQALPLVSTFWGILLFGEYRASSKRTYVLLIAMLCMFAAAVGLLMGSAGDRQR